MKKRIEQEQTEATESLAAHAEAQKIADKTLTDKIVRVGSVDELQALIDEPMICSFMLDNRTIEIRITRMSATTMEVVRKIKRQVVPPYDEKRKDYDLLNAAYIDKKETAERQARSLIIYRHCPIVAAKRANLTGIVEIDQFVQGLFSENILEVLALKIQMGGIDVDERVNFTLAGG